MASPPDSVAGEAPASESGDDAQSEPDETPNPKKPAASPRCSPPKRKRLTQELADYNSAAFIVSPSPADSVSIAASSESGKATTRRSPRENVPVKRLCDPTDGSELEEKGESPW